MTPSEAARPDGDGASGQHPLGSTPGVGNVGGWTWEIGSGEVVWSEELYRIFGVSPSEFVPSSEALFSRVDRRHRSRCRSIVLAVLAEGTSGAFEFPTVRPDGVQRWIRALCQVEFDSEGVAVRLRGLAQDVTDLSGEAPDAVITTSDSAAVDPLTGVARRGLFEHRSSVVLDRARTKGWCSGVLIVDIDHFCRVNERFGYEAGNLVLTTAAHRLRNGLDPSRAAGMAGVELGRLGGDRFAIMCERIGEGDEEAACLRFAEAFAESVGLGLGEVHLTAGIGMSVTRPGVKDIGRLLGEADSALRTAKQRGRGSYAVFTEDPVDSRLLGSPAGRELEAAFLRHEMRLHYQPKFELATGAMVAVEALIRWEHPERGRLLPSAFFPLAEQTGLIVPIGAWVIQEACRQARRWQDAFPERPLLEVSVNVSARQFDAQLLTTVAEALATSGARPSSLCVEITESLLMRSPERAERMLGELSALGVAMSIDDFGTGYSSLARLKSFPLDELKIDKSFVDGLGDHGDDTAIVASIVAMAHAMDLRVVAEGVETSEQADRLETLGCDQVQGFLFGMRGPAADIDALLREGVPSKLGANAAAGGDLATPARYRPLRVLVVDDSADVCQLASVTLTAAGFAVTAVGGGAAAMAAAAAEPPDCVLLDLIMPDINGIDVCRALRSHPATSGCTILILTSVSDARGKIDAFIAGADDYIVKPFSPRHLLDRVNAEMRRSRGDADVDGAPATGEHTNAEPGRPLSRRSRSRHGPGRELGGERTGGRHV